MGRAEICLLSTGKGQRVGLSWQELQVLSPLSGNGANVMRSCGAYAGLVNRSGGENCRAYAAKESASGQGMHILIFD